MPELLLEVGCEEIPAGSLEQAAQDLKDGVESRLREAGLSFEPREPLFTPRRLIVSLGSVPDRQPDQERVHRGPALPSAYSPDGSPTKALEGFCRGQGVDPSEVVKEGEHVWVRKVTPGLSTLELLGTVLPEAIVAVRFAKTMRWGNGTVRFARPIRWIVAVFDSKIVPFVIEGVSSGSQSRGHRFRGPADFEARNLDELVNGLRARFVEASFAQRKEMIATGASKYDLAAQGDLVAENANLAEWPEVLMGEFRPEFLELPGPVLVTVMAKHERFFPVRGPDGGLKNQFVSVRNGGEEEAVRAGNAWVLNARFNDARFFFEEDKKHTLDEFLGRTASMTFQDRLGTVRQRADRLSGLAHEVALWSGADPAEAKFAEQAGLYCKADLTTGLVSELDELQGVIGGEYAKREGFPDPVCWAIASHYDWVKNLNPDCPGGRTAQRTLMADQLDKLAGYLGIGMVPSGSSDPYGLRRAANLLIHVAWTWPESQHLGSFLPVFRKAAQGYTAQGLTIDEASAEQAFLDLMGSRYASLEDEGLPDIPYHVVEAAVIPGEQLADPVAVRQRARILDRLWQDAGFVQTATRPANIVSAAEKKGIDFGRAEVTEPALESAEGASLLRAANVQGPLATLAFVAGDVDGVVACLRNLVEPVNAFFDSTMVMVDDATVRDARLKLLSEVDNVFRLAGDFTKIVIEG